MEEIALVISSLAGACTAVAMDKIPKRKQKQAIIVNSAIEGQLHSLKIEKEILSKTIARLHNDGTVISAVQRDRLLSRYQHQLGVTSSKIEKLEVAVRYPDLGPVGDSLITLMDEKLSKLDQRLYEISSKMTTANIVQPATQIAQLQMVQPQPPTIKQHEQQKPVSQEKPRVEPKAEAIEEGVQIQKEKAPDPMPPIEISLPQRHVSVELSTLTKIPDRMPEFPTELIKTVQRHPDRPEAVAEPPRQTQIPQSIVPVEPTPLVPREERPQEKPEHIEKKVHLPTPIKILEEEKIEDDDNDLDKIKNEIMRALSKLEQAEVE